MVVSPQGGTPTTATVALPPVPACAQRYFSYLPAGAVLIDDTPYAVHLDMEGTDTVTDCSATHESGTISFSMASNGNLETSVVSCSQFSGTYVRQAEALQILAASAGCTVAGVSTGPVNIEITGAVEYQVTNGECCPTYSDYQAEFLLYQ